MASHLSVVLDTEVETPAIRVCISSHCVGILGAWDLATHTTATLLDPQNGAELVIGIVFWYYECAKRWPVLSGAGRPLLHTRTQKNKHKCTHALWAASQCCMKCAFIMETPGPDHLMTLV